MLTMLNQTLDTLGKRITDAIETCESLIKDKRYYDAFEIIGHAFETCSILCYIKDCKEDSDRIERLSKYLASSYHYVLLKKYLEIPGSMEDEDSKTAYSGILLLFSIFGSLIIEDSKIKEGESHDSFIKQLAEDDITNEDKKKILNKKYKQIPVQDYIDCFKAELVKSDSQKWFNDFYIDYCCHKHCNYNNLTIHNLENDVYVRNMEHFIKYIKKYMEDSKNKNGIWRHVSVNPIN